MDIKAKLKEMGKGPKKYPSPGVGVGDSATPRSQDEGKATSGSQQRSGQQQAKPVKEARVDPKKVAKLHESRNFSRMLAAAEANKRAEEHAKRLEALNEVRAVRERIGFQDTQDAPPKWQRVKFHRRAKDPSTGAGFQRPMAGSPSRIFLEHLQRVDEQAEKRWTGQEVEEKAIASFITRTKTMFDEEEEGTEEEGWGADPSVGVSTQQKRELTFTMRAATTVLKKPEDPDDPSFDVSRGYYSRTQPQRGPTIVNDPFHPTRLPQPGTRGRNFSSTLVKKVNESGSLAASIRVSSPLRPRSQASSNRTTVLAPMATTGRKSAASDVTAPSIPPSESDSLSMKRLREALGSTSLVLARIGYTELPAALRTSLAQCMGSFRELSISNNRVTALEKDFFVRWRSLHRFLASGNRLSFIDEEIGSLKYLTELDVSNNRLVQLPVAIGTLPLRLLNADGNSLTRLPPIHTTTLQTLKARQNALGGLPYGLNRCTKLQHIDVSFNGVAALFIIPAIDVAEDPDLSLDPSMYYAMKNPENGKDMWMHKITKEVSKTDPALRLQRAREGHADAMRRMDRRLRGEGGEESEEEEEKEEWVELIDPVSAAPYYQNVRTGETSWEDKRGQKSTQSEDPMVNMKTYIQQQIQSMNEKKDTASPKPWKPPLPPGPPPDSDDEKEEEEGSDGGSLLPPPTPMSASTAITRASTPATPKKGDMDDVKAQLQLDLSPILTARGDRGLRRSHSSVPPSAVAAAAPQGKAGSPSLLASRTEGTASVSTAATRKSKKKKPKIRLAPSVIERQRLRALKALGRSDWDMIVDPVTGAVHFRNNLTMKETEAPPPHIDTIGELQFLRSLVLSHNKLALLPDSLGALFRLEELRIDNNILTEESFPHSFAKLQLTNLDLSHNRLRKIPHSITRMDTLRVLKLDSNKLSRIPKHISRLRLLQVFQARDNRIRTLPVEIRLLEQNLRTVDLARNPLESVWEEAIHKGLQHVYHYCRRIINEDKHGPPPSMTYQRMGIELECVAAEAETEQWMKRHLEAATQEKSLPILFKGLSVFPESALKLTDLRKLVVIGNVFQDIPAELSCLSKLVSLTWRANNTESVGNALSAMPNLRELNLDHNDIAHIDAEQLRSLNKLRLLRLNVNRITRLPHDLFAPLTSLVELWLDGNKLDMLPDSTYSLQNLRALLVNFNSLPTFPDDITKLTALSMLRADSNQVSSISRAMCSMVQLKELQLGANCITEIPYWMPSSNLSITLEKLHLQNNDLSVLPMDFHFLSTLTELKLENNPRLRTPPLSVCSGGASAVLAYCALRHRNFLQLVEAADRYQFALNMSGVFPVAQAVLTGGLGWLPPAVVRGFDAKVDRFVNTEAHASDETTADRMFKALADAREAAVEGFRAGVFERFMKALVLTEEEGWVAPSHFRTDVLRPWGPRKKFTRAYAISYEAFFGEGTEAGAIPRDVAANALGPDPRVPDNYPLEIMRMYRPDHLAPKEVKGAGAGAGGSEAKGKAADTAGPPLQRGKGTKGKVIPQGLAAKKEAKVRQVHLGVAKGGRETGILAAGGHLGGKEAHAKPPPEVMYDPPVTGTAPGEPGFIPVAHRMEIRVACGDTTCAGPPLTPHVVLEAVRYQRGLFGRKTAVGEVVDYSPDSMDASAVEVEPFTVSSFFHHPTTLSGNDTGTLNALDAYRSDIEQAAKEGLASAYKEYLAAARRRRFSYSKEGSTPTSGSRATAPSPAHSLQSPLSRMSEEQSQASTEVEKVKMKLLSGESRYKSLVLPPSRLQYGQVPEPVQLGLKKKAERKSFVVLYRDWSSQDLLREVHEMREMEEVERQIREDAELLYKTPEGKAIIRGEVANRKRVFSMALTRAKRMRRMARERLRDIQRAATALLQARNETFLHSGGGAVEHHVVQGILRKRYLTVEKAQKEQREKDAIQDKRRKMLTDLPGGVRHLEEDAYLQEKQETDVNAAVEEEGTPAPTVSDKLRRRLERYAAQSGVDNIDEQIRTVLEVRAACRCSSMRRIPHGCARLSQSLSGIQKMYAKWSVRYEKAKEKVAALGTGKMSRKVVKEDYIWQRTLRARKRFLNRQRLLALHEGFERWWDGVDGANFASWKELVTMRPDADGMPMFIPPALDEEDDYGLSESDDDEDEEEEYDLDAESVGSSDSGDTGYTGTSRGLTNPSSEFSQPSADPNDSKAR